MEFKDKRVLITGGTKGLGKATAISFAREGAWVAVTYSSDDKAASETESLLKKDASRSLLIKADVSLGSDVKKMADQVINQWEYLDVLVNNAGINQNIEIFPLIYDLIRHLVNNAGIIRDNMLLFIDEEDWDRVIDVNLKGTYLCSRAFIKSMIARRSGRIINTASPSAITGRAGQTNYSASKGGVISFTKSLSKEVARLGITVNAVCPGIISTPLTDTLDQQTRNDFSSMIPMKRFGEPEEIAWAVLFLASERSGYITGQVLRVDGGLI